MNKQHATVPQGSGIYLMYQCTRLDGTEIAPNDVASITLHSQCLSTGEEVGTETYTNSAVFGTYQTDAKWTKDRKGYRIGLAAPATLMPDGDETYQLDAVINYTDTSTDALKARVVYVERTYE